MERQHAICHTTCPLLWATPRETALGGNTTGGYNKLSMVIVLLHFIACRLALELGSRLSAVQIVADATKHVDSVNTQEVQVLHPVHHPGQPVLYQLLSP